MEDFFFQLPLFPTGSLQGSVMIPIFFGVLLMTLLTERFGWVFSGIVVPGYLVPIIIVAPWSAGIIILEAFITIVLVQLLTVHLFRARLWPPFFGRDKFFLILLASVGVRLVMEIYALPIVGEYIQQFDPYFDYRNRFKAIGLIVVPLMANMVWKQGILRGFLHMAVVTAGTLGLIMFILVPFTNYSIGYFFYIYEVAALDFAASPSAYIVILLGAFVASRANLYLGWDFSGIMVPTLLALALLTPLRFVLTVMEAVVIVMATKTLMRIPWFGNTTWEGPRLVCLMYAVSLVIKVSTGHVIETITPGFPYETLFAYGYLLSTLMAMKMYQKDVIVRVSLPVMTISLIIVVVAHLLVQSVSSVDENQFIAGSTDAVTEAQEQLAHIERSPYEIMQQERAAILQPGQGGIYAPMLPQESEQFRELVRFVGNLTANKTPFDSKLSWQSAQVMANDLGFRLSWIGSSYYDQRGYVLLHEIEEGERRRGWGSLLYRTGQSNGCMILVPRPLQEAGSLEAAMVLQKSLSAHVIVMPGAHPDLAEDGKSDPLRWLTVPMNTAAQALSHYTALEVRLLPSGEQQQLWVASALPSNIPVRELTEVLSDMPIHFPPQRSPVENRILRKVQRPAYLTLALHQEDIQRLLFAQYRRERGNKDEAVAIDIERRGVNRSLMTLVEELAQVYTGDVEPLGIDELVVWKQMVAQPIAELAHSDDAEWLSAAAERLAPVQEVANSHGFQLRLWQDLSGGLFVVINERVDQAQGHGVFVIRLGEAEAYHLLAPLPMTLSGTAESSIQLFLQSRARSLSIGSLGVAEPGQPRVDREFRQQQGSLFQLFFQELHRYSWGGEELVGIEILGADAVPGVVERGCLLRQGSLVGGESGLSPAIGRFVAHLRRCGLETLVHDSSEEVVDLRLLGNPQYGYAHAHAPGEHAALWLDRETRRYLSRTMPPLNRQLALQSLDLPRQVGEFDQILPAWWDRLPERSMDKDLLLFWSRVPDEIQQYNGDRNLIRIEFLVEQARRSGLATLLLHELSHNSLHLVMGFRAPGGPRQLLICNLEPLTTTMRTVTSTGWNEAVGDYLGFRQALLQVTEAMPDPDTRPEETAP